MIPDLLKVLYNSGIRTLMVEGGATIIDTFLAESARAEPNPIIDTLIITIAPTLVGDEGVGYGTTDQVSLGLRSCTIQFSFPF